MSATTPPAAVPLGKERRISLAQLSKMGVSWLLLATLAYGSYELWLGVWTAIYAGKVFPGASPLLVLGSLFPFFRGSEAYSFARNRQNPLEARRRFGVLALIMLFNMVPNVVCIGWAVGSQIKGSAPWTEFDSWIMVLGGFFGIVTVSIWKKRAWSEPKSRFFWVVSWRTIPIGALTIPAFVPGAPTMPTGSALGLTLIALVALSFILLQVFSRPAGSLRESYLRLRWLLWAEVANFWASLGLWLVLVAH